MTFRLLSFLGLAFLASCSKPEQQMPEPVFRNIKQPIGSAALFNPKRFSGRWHDVARFPGSFLNCAPGSWEFSLTADSYAVTTPCNDKTGLAQVKPAGRMTLTLNTGDSAEIWILWVDEGYRTAVLGSPDGRVGWILNREPAIPMDRLRAAREILDFNGFRLDRLEER